MMKHCLPSHHYNRYAPIRSGGFTFVEVLAAMLFMAILIPVVVQGLTIANRAGVIAERKRKASQLADSLLSELVVTGEWRNGDEEGDFGEDWPGYRWILQTQSWDVDTMRMITLQVLYRVQEKDYSVILSTLAPEEEQVVE